MTKTHEERLRTEMTVAQQVWRENHPVIGFVPGQSVSDYRDNQDATIWSEASFLVSGKASDETARHVAAELTLEGRTMPDGTEFKVGALAMGLQSLAMTDKPVAGIVYEGIDASEHENRWLKSLDLPGEKVRIDTEARIHGVDVHDKMDQLGMDPLTISKSIVRTEMQPDHMGGERAASYLEYEFEGKEGRHPAKQFMEEGGREHMYGVLLVRDDRMWAVPLAEDEIKRDGVMLIDGPAREVVGFAGKDQDDLHPEGFGAMKESVREENGAAGKFYVQARDGYGAPGPINILNSPWQSSASMEEMGIANGAIDKAIARETREREDPVGVLVDRMDGLSKRWRLEREHVDFTGRHGEGFHAAPPTTDLKTAERLSNEEASYLMRGHDPKDANVRMAAAMVATEGRETKGGSLNSRTLADSLYPASDRKGVLTQAAANLSGRTATSKGPVSESAMPPFGATMIRKGTER